MRACAGSIRLSPSLVLMRMAYGPLSSVTTGAATSPRSGWPLKQPDAHYRYAAPTTAAGAFVAAFISARARLEQSPVARRPSVFPDWLTNAASAKHIKREVDRALDPEAVPS